MFQCTNVQLSESEARNTEYLEEVTLQRPAVVEPIERGVLLKREVMPSSAEDRNEFLMAVCFRQKLYSPNTSSFFRIYENVLRMTSNLLPAKPKISIAPHLGQTRTALFGSTEGASARRRPSLLAQGRAKTCNAGDGGHRTQ